MTPERLEEIRSRIAKAFPGPWKWEQSYEFDDDGKHWALHNPEKRDGGYGDGLSRVTNGFLMVARGAGRTERAATVREAIDAASRIPSDSPTDND